MDTDLDEEIEDFLEHFGMKGMKWGVRQQRRLNRLQPATRKGNTASKFRAISGYTGIGVPGGFGPVGPIDLIKGRGITGGAKRKFERVSSRENRIRAGKAHVSDRIMHYGSMRPIDLIPVRTKNVNKKNILDKAGAAVAIGGALYVASLIAKHGAQTA